MATRLYFVIFILPFFSGSLCLASPWPVKEGKYLYITEFQKSDATTEKIIARESNIYYQIESKIQSLYDQIKYVLRDRALPESVKHLKLYAIYRRIDNLKKMQSNYRAFCPSFMASQYIEYGINPKNSVVIKFSSAHSIDFHDSVNFTEEMLFGTKHVIYRDNRHIFSLEPSINILNTQPYQVDSEAKIELKLNYGYSKVYKKHTKFNYVEFGIGYNDGNKYHRANYTRGIKLESDFIFLLQTFNTIEMKMSKLYKKTSFNKFSIAKHMNICNSPNKSNDLTMQAGYFFEYDYSAKRLLNSGVILSLWVEI